MAFGNNYAYNPYINPYASPYNPQPQPMMQNFQQQQQPMPQIQQQTPQNGFVWVDGIEEANNFYVAPNNAVQLWDKNSPCIYKKSADAAGKPTMQIFDLVERKNETPSKIDFKPDLSDFVKRDEITLLEQRIAALEAIKRAKKEKEATDNG